jgi:hypothetical protein
MPLDAYFPPSGRGETADPFQLHRQLTLLARARMEPRLDASDWQAALDDEYRLRRLECAFIEAERATIADWAGEAPSDPDGFIAWFENLKQLGPGQCDALFPWLAYEATRDEMRWFLEQEMAGEAGFDDLVALTQVQLPMRAKLELARNYWDEMGQGTAAGMHGPMLQRLAQELDLSVSLETTVWESLALANVMVALAFNRQYAFHSVGALGAIELTAPGRSVLVNAGLKRLGLHGEARRYYALHATLDIKHSAAWGREVLYPLVGQDPARARAIAEGALLRLRAGARCFERYRSELFR